MWIIHLYTASGEHWYDIYRLKKDAIAGLKQFTEMEYYHAKTQAQRDACDIDRTAYVFIENEGDNYYIGA